MRKTLHRCAAVLALTAIMASVSVWTGATTAMAAAPSAPRLLTVTPSPTTTDGTVALTWTAPSSGSAAYYEVFRQNGTGTPSANEVTFIGQTDDAAASFVDQLPTEGTFKYAVMAIDENGNAGPVSSWVQVTANFPSNGSTIQRDTTAPAAVTNLKAEAAYTTDHTIVLTWNASTASDLWRYLVYRKKGSATPELIGYVSAGESTVTDIVSGDGSYQYTIKAQDETGNVSGSSGSVTVVADSTAPAITVSSPVAGRTYTGSGTMAITATITDKGAGYVADSVKYFLDDVALTGPSFSLNNLESGAHTVRIEVTDKAGNLGSKEVQFIVDQVNVNPAAPQSLTADAYSKSRTVALDWAAPTTGASNVKQYVIYRAATGEEPTLISTTAKGTTYYTDTVPADGVYSYYVVASYDTEDHESNTIAVTVDTVAPAIKVTTPQNGVTYANTSPLTVKYTVTDAGGYDEADVHLLLDGAAFTGTQIDLADLTIGEHTFKVSVTDRAGNAASKSVKFSVNTTGTGGNDGEDDEDEDEDQGQPNAALIALLSKPEIQTGIHHGHYVSLMAMARAGKIRQFTLTVIKFSGKFINPDVAKKLLEAVGAENLNISPKAMPDDDFWMNHGKGNGKGKGR